jgi:hypothetical protein
VYVKEQMGHSSIQVTVDIYGHLIPGANVSFVDRLDEAPQESAETTPHQSAPGTHQSEKSETEIPSEVLDFEWWRRLDSNQRPTDYESPHAC